MHETTGRTFAPVPPVSRPFSFKNLISAGILLYLTPEGIEEVKELINKTSFKLFYLKQILLDEIKYLDLNKAYHNKDSQEKKEMN